MTVNDDPNRLEQETRHQATRIVRNALEERSGGRNPANATFLDMLADHIVNELRGHKTLYSDHEVGYYQTTEAQLVRSRLVRRMLELENHLATVRAYALVRVQSHDVDVYSTAKGVLDIVGTDGPLSSPVS